MLYQYKAKNNAGAVVKGRLEAENQKKAVTLLSESGLFVMTLKKSTSFSFINLLPNPIPLKDKIIFTKQLGMMIKSGLPLLDALKSLEEESINKKLSRIIVDLAKEVEGGAALSKALEKHPEAFDEIYINMVKSGEESGKIDMVLNRLADHLEKDYDLVRKIKGALSYPIFIMITMVVVVALVITLVIPQLKTIFEDSGVQLPLATRALISTSLFLKGYGLYLLAGLCALTILLYRWGKTIAGKRFFDKLVLRIPLISMLLKKSYMARFTRTFSSLISSGLPLLEVFTSSGKVLGNVIYEEEIAVMTKKVEQGTALSAVFKKSKLFPAMIGQLAAVGEKSGNVDEVFESMAQFFDKEVENITSNLSTLLEPALMVVIGVFVGIVIMSVLQPIYGLVNAI